MTEMNASVVLVYCESFGCGMDTDGDTPDGVTVSLTFWEGTGDVDFLYVKPHYVLMSRVVVDRQIVINSQHLIQYQYNDTKVLRHAIETFDGFLKHLPGHGKEREG